LIEGADLVFDVGSVFDPAILRFDHHQKSYVGSRSSAGMVLDWLVESGGVALRLGDLLRAQLVDYVDDVDNGRREPDPHVPCFARLVETMNRGNRTNADYDAAFVRAARIAEELLQGHRLEHEELEVARGYVRTALEEADRRQSNLLVLPEYIRWKPAYFDITRGDHPTEFVVHPGLDGSWRASAIPPEENSFAQKRPLPQPWAGLADEALVAVTGVPGSRFCHKNRFIAVFESWEALMEAFTRWEMIQGVPPVFPGGMGS
jgi:uncharacterized UPF0160 family protein